MENLVRWKFVSRELRFKGKLVEVTYKIKNKVEVLATEEELRRRRLDRLVTW
jgi:hypothetical protein